MLLDVKAVNIGVQSSGNWERSFIWLIREVHRFFHYYDESMVTRVKYLSVEIRLWCADPHGYSSLTSRENVPNKTTSVVSSV